MGSHGGQVAIRDEIHQDILFDNRLWFFISHPYVQRLRRVKQLGFTELVFPSANHNRFQHCLGVSFLAAQAFELILSQWTSQNLDFPKSTYGLSFLHSKTKKKIVQILESASARSFWKDVLSLAGLLHDVGHGPFSHSFELLNLKQDFSKDILELPKSVQSYLSAQRYLLHEDISLIYLYHLFKEAKTHGVVTEIEPYYFCISYLIHKKIRTSPDFHRDVLSTLKRLTKAKVNSDLFTLNLFSLIISGPFDVDKIDYIQRDGRNCGVAISGVEWKRLLSKVFPCIALTRSEQIQPILLASFKNQPLLEDFQFTLFQMYAQVYLHPKVIGFEEMIRKELLKHPLGSLPKINFKLHQELSDEGFIEILRTHIGLPSFNEFFVSKKFEFKSVISPEPTPLKSPLKHMGYQLVKNKERKLLKERVPVFLYSSTDRGSSKEILNIQSWYNISKVASLLETAEYHPNVWIKHADH